MDTVAVEHAEQGEQEAIKDASEGLQTFLMELFAGAATLSYMAVHIGFALSAPIDIIYDSRYDLLKKANRDKIDQMIEQDDPFLSSMSPVCGPWSSWQNVNMEDRKNWYPVLKWLAGPGVIRKRI